MSELETQLSPRTGEQIVSALRIEVVDGPDRCRHVVGGEVVSVGTARDNALAITDFTVSRYHLEVSVRPGGILVADLGSTNGTYVGAVRIERAIVPPGTLVKLGGTTIRFDDAVRRAVPSDGSRLELAGMIGASPHMQRMFADIERVAASPTAVLIVGESGTGKERVAEALHARSPRARSPLVTIDCGALSSSLLASELFGHERGAFTGADRLHRGAFERAADGTVFLDVPTFEWEPVSWATEYELVLARDQDFTNVLGTFRTKNTRLVPLQRLPENTAIRSYYWYVVPCVESGDSTPCLNENRVVNREGKFRSFKKQSVLVKLSSIERRGTPWVEFTWEPYSQTMARFAHKTGTAGASMGSTPAAGSRGSSYSAAAALVICCSLPSQPLAVRGATSPRATRWPTALHHASTSARRIWSTGTVPKGSSRCESLVFQPSSEDSLLTLPRSMRRFKSDSA